jgi:hypothetical protein
MAGGQSTVRLDARADDANGLAVIAVDAEVAQGFAYPWAGVAYLPGDKPMQPANLGAARAIAFRVRGDGRRYQLSMLSQGASYPRSVGFDAGREWSEVKIPLNQFQGVDPTAVLMIGFNAGPQPGSYRFEISDVRLLAD